MSLLELVVSFRTRFSIRYGVMLFCWLSLFCSRWSLASKHAFAALGTVRGGLRLACWPSLLWLIEPSLYASTLPKAVSWEKLKLPFRILCSSQCCTFQRNQPIEKDFVYRLGSLSLKSVFSFLVEPANWDGLWLLVRQYLS